MRTYDHPQCPVDRRYVEARLGAPAGWRRTLPFWVPPPELVAFLEVSHSYETATLASAPLRDRARLQSRSRNGRPADRGSAGARARASAIVAVLFLDNASDRA